VTSTKREKSKGKAHQDSLRRGLSFPVLRSYTTAAHAGLRMTLEDRAKYLRDCLSILSAIERPAVDES